MSWGSRAGEKIQNSLRHKAKKSSFAVTNFTMTI